MKNPTYERSRAEIAKILDGARDLGRKPVRHFSIETRRYSEVKLLRVFKQGDLYYAREGAYYMNLVTALDDGTFQIGERIT
jgi:hypothetical protein